MVVDELYALPRDQFIAVRSERVKQARSQGERAVAADIAELRKPSTAAWLVNQIAREYPDSVRNLVELGAQMRAAHERRDGDALRALSDQRHGQIRDLLTRLAALANEHGTPASAQILDDIQKAVSAALADAEVATQLLSGRLSALPHPSADSEQWLVAGEAAAAKTDTRTAAGKSEQRDDSSGRPTQRPRDAQRQAAREEVTKARNELNHAEVAVRKAAEVVRHRQEELTRAEQDHRQALRRLERAEQHYQQASEHARSIK